MLTPRAFAAPGLQDRQTWRLRLTIGGVLAVCDFPEARRAFPLAAFAGDPRLAPLLARAKMTAGLASRQNLLYAPLPLPRPGAERTVGACAVKAGRQR